MKTQNKKGFTIVELVIVIAVIAILAAVLIPTFINLTKKANESNTTALLRNLNVALANDKALNGAHKTAHSAVLAAKAAGYDLPTIAKEQAEAWIVWDADKDEFVKETETGNVNQWKFCTSDKNNGYSMYWIGEAKDAPATVSVGFDAGDTTGISMTYDGAETVTIRTNGGTLTVDNANATVHHYGAASIVDIQAVKSESYHEYGAVVLVKITNGRFVAEESARVVTVYAANKNVELVENAGASVSTYAGTAVTVEGKAGVNFEDKTEDELTKAAEKSEVVAEGGVAEINGIRFKTLQGAFDAAKDGDTVRLISDYMIPDNVQDSVDDRIVIRSKITLDFGKYRVIGQAKMDKYIKNFTAIIVAADTVFTADDNGGVFTSVSSEGMGPYGVNIMNGAKLTIKGGSYFGGGTAIQVQKGELEILDGKFSCAPYDEPYGYKYVINVIDNAFKDGTAKATIKGGYFVKFNPSDNPEGVGTSYVADGYVVMLNNDGSEYNYVVRKS